MDFKSFRVMCLFMAVTCPFGLSGAAQPFPLTMDFSPMLARDASSVLPSERFSLLARLATATSGGDFADFDNDDDFDVLLPFGTIIFRNNGSNQFTRVSSMRFPYDYTTTTAIGDFNNDGFLDILQSGQQLGTTLLVNDGPGSFRTNTPPLLRRVAFSSLASADFDNDGRLDFAGTGISFITTNSPILRLYRNLGDGTFYDIQAGLAGISYGSVDWGDFDGDGRLDLLVTGTDSLSGSERGRQPTRVFHNNSDGTFTDMKLPLPGVWLGAAIWGDYDNDGLLDILIAGAPGAFLQGGLTRLYLNNGDGTFASVEAGLPAVEEASVAWGDFDNDGDLDLIIMGRRPGGVGALTRVYVNNGNGTFTDLEAGLPSGFGGTVACADVDSDGALDVLISWDGGTTIYRNNLGRKNTPPTAPTNLAATIQPHNNVSFWWNSSSDNETTNAHGLNYNLRIGTTPGGIDVMSPQSDLSTGQRHVARRGNAGSDNHWILANLPRGTYYWSVQAIDTGFAGSSFSSESSFAISNDLDTASNHAPAARALSVATLEDKPVAIQLTASDLDGDALTYILASLPTNGVLRGIAPNLFYTPNQDFFGKDSFAFRVRDGLASSATENVIIEVAPVPDVEHVGATLRGALDAFWEFELQVTLEPATSYRLDWSEDCVNWLPFMELKSPPTNQSIFFNNQNGVQKEFFRLNEVR
jgi:hypothetical protein